MSTCRFCGADISLDLVDLGEQPPSNSYLKSGDAPEKAFPLRTVVCEDCYLVQLADEVPPGEIFNADYAYYSSFSVSWVAHAKAYAADMIKRFQLGANSKVVEIASNDGYLLQHFVGAGVPVLGVDPAAGCAAAAKEKGVETEVAFFNAETATRLKAAGHSADLMAANNVLAHVPDIRSFVEGFAVLLKDDGVVTFEYPHLLNLLNLVQFDTIYHEHYSYLSLLAVERIFSECGLRAFDVQELTTHGGSLRVFACKKACTQYPDQPELTAMRLKEKTAGLDSRLAYQGFQAKCEAVREGLLSFLADARDNSKTVVGYGAAAKGNTLLNYAGVDADQIDFVCDGNPAKQGTYLPGSRIPVLSPDHIETAKPDYVVILPWNLKTEIGEQLSSIRTWGGQFVVAVPQIEVW
ncbi:class I SAM-dependent methyltransferase [Magnetovibrio sp. PR-2]|uniref:class I SAM-dependent methyltransferase n=1 Tax=Magnetovibrio sp. PR-2 TaxID=3120356 RepID=UPI002FCE2900